MLSRISSLILAGLFIVTACASTRTPPLDLDEKGAKFEDAVTRISQNCLVPFEVVIELTDLEKEHRWGSTCKWNDGTFHIKIEQKISSEAFKISILMHEWAHVLAWDYARNYNEGDHSAAWGLAYSKVYKAVYGN